MSTFFKVGECIFLFYCKYNIWYIKYKQWKISWCKYKNASFGYVYAFMIQSWNVIIKMYTYWNYVHMYTHTSTHTSTHNHAMFHKHIITFWNIFSYIDIHKYADRPPTYKRLFQKILRTVVFSFHQLWFTYLTLWFTYLTLNSWDSILSII